jgi:hypothetical protein
MRRAPCDRFPLNRLRQDPGAFRANRRRKGATCLGRSGPAHVLHLVEKHRRNDQIATFGSCGGSVTRPATTARRCSRKALHATRRRRAACGSRQGIPERGCSRTATQLERFPQTKSRGAVSEPPAVSIVVFPCARSQRPEHQRAARCRSRRSRPAPTGPVDPRRWGQNLLPCAFIKHELQCEHPLGLGLTGHSAELIVRNLTNLDRIISNLLRHLRHHSLLSGG